MRVDRNGSVLAIVSITLTKEQKRPRELQLLDQFLAERLRLTDTPGWRHDGRLGVLLPDTPRDGAEIVAGEIVEFIKSGRDGDEVEIAMYPENFQSVLPSDTDTQVRPKGEPVGTPAGGSHVAIRDRRPEVEALFVQPMPVWKRLVDVLGVSVGLLIAGPVLLLLAAAVACTSRGGAFFLQEREGLGGRRFKIIKLRTMIPDAEHRKENLLHHSVQDGPAFKMYRDPRVTLVGRFLRATSLDELPQLINVLRGEMSLVGPRPLPVEESLACQPWQRQRLQVTPGITCIWQVSGRNTVSFDEWMRMDLRYARRHTLWGDLKLVLGTGPSLMLVRGPR